MRILFVSHSAEVMGAERSLVALVREAARVRGHRVAVTVPAPGPLTARLAEAGAEVVVLPTRLWMGRRYNLPVGLVRLAQSAASVPRYRRFLARSRPDLVVTNSAVVPAGAVAARLARIPHVWVVRESLLTNPSLRSALPRSVIARTIARLADDLVAVSDYVAAQVSRAAPGAERKLRVIPPPVDAASVPPPPAACPPPGQALRRLVLLGRYSEEKGQADAVAAVGICRRRGREVSLRLAGTGDRRAARALTELAREHGVADLVEVCDWVAEPEALYASADATLMLSRNEAYGRVTVESLLAGTPVIGYRAGGTTEILAGGGGALVRPDPAALASAVLDLAADAGAFGRLRADAVRRGRELASGPPAASVFVAHLELLRAAR